MRCFKKFSLMLMLVAAFFMTGCDAQQIIDTITQVAQGVQQAAPAIRDAVNTAQGIFSNDNNNNNQATPAAPTPTPAPTQPTETAADNPAEVFVPNSTDEEEITIPPANNSQQSAATQTGTTADPRTSYTNLLNAAKAEMSGVSADCYNTSVRTANANGASGDGFSWPSSTRYRGQGVAQGMKQAIASGHLKPGMVIYICKNPGTDPNSLNLSNLPHWYTYLGKDTNGVDRFSDQYFTDLTIEGLASNYPNRLVDEILDPYRR